MLKYILTLILLSAPISQGKAVEQNISIDHMIINQSVSDSVSFRSSAVEASYYYMSEYDIGGRVGVGKGIKAASKSEGVVYTNKIDVIYTAEIFYRLNLNNKHIDFGIGKTDYKTTWTVDNKKNEWSHNTDSDWSYHLRFSFELAENVYLNFGYSDIYRKSKSTHTEETKYFKVGFLYKFNQ